MAFAKDHRTRVFDQILASWGLTHIGENIFDQLDGESLANCEEVSPIWRQFIVNNGVKLWKRQYLEKLAKPGSDAHRLIKSNPKLFQADLQADQGKFQIFAVIIVMILPSKNLRIVKYLTSVKSILKVVHFSKNNF
jgi:hypothetical protein